MPRTLILMRHAKSSWDDPATDDHDRPLNGRGRRSAVALGDWLRDTGWLPDQVLCSTATRTRETYAGLNIPLAAEFHSALYHASAATMRQLLAAATGRTVLMIGHNPGIGDFARRLLAAPPDHPRFADYPTGATLVARFDIASWDRLDWQSGRAADFTVPRDLSVG